VQPARRGTDAFGDGRREGNHVVLRRRFDLLDSGDVERRARPQLQRGIAWNQPRFRHRVCGGELHLQPGFVAAAIAPDRAHFGVRVSGNHR